MSTDAPTVDCRSCNATLDPRETDTVDLADESLVVCTQCWSWTAFADDR